MKKFKILNWLGITILLITFVVRMIDDPSYMFKKEHLEDVAFYLISLGIVFLIYKFQRFLSSRKNKYLGLILPVIWFFGTSIAVIVNYLDDSNPDHGPLIPNLILLCLLNIFTWFGFKFYKLERELLKIKS